MNEEPANVIQKSRNGRKKISVVVVLLLVVVVAGLLCVALLPKEPSYNGKSLSYWLERYEEAGLVSADTKDPKAIEAREAIRHIGTNAIPTLMRMLKAKDSDLKLKLMSLLEKQNFVHFRFSPAEERNSLAVQGFFCLADLATGSVPALVDIYNHPPSSFSKESADDALMAIYPASDAAVPFWVPPPKRAEWCNSAGQLKLELGARADAILAFSEAIRLDPTNASAYLSRASAKTQLQDYAGALGDAQRSIELDSSNEAAFYASGLCEFALKDFKTADANFTTAINLETNDVNAYNSRGLARANLRRLDDALADFNKVIELSPREATAYRNRALVEGMQKEYEAALEDVSKSLDLDSKDAIAYLFRGRIKSALKDYKSALLDLDRAIEMNPKDSAAYSARGTTGVSMDDFEAASRDLKKALELDPKNVAAYVARGYLEAKHGDEDASALADLQRAVELGAQTPETHVMLGLFQYKIFQWVPAMENCHRALELGATGGAGDMRACIWLILAQTGKEADANKEMETYLNSLQGAKTNSWDASIARFLSGSLAENTFLEQATTTARRPSAVRSQVCESLYYAGMKRKLAGDTQGALEFFNKCLDTRDDNDFAYLNAGVEMRAVKKN